MFTLALLPCFWAADIRSQWLVLRDKEATAVQVEQAVERLCSYGELSYHQLKDSVAGVAERRCRQFVWPRVLAPRTKKLIDSLSDGHFVVRQRASEELMEIGKFNRILILQSVAGSNLEKRQRLDRIIIAISSKD
jgi:hypothetical protein